jgi:hypothetical protein
MVRCAPLVIALAACGSFVDPVAAPVRPAVVVPPPVLVENHVTIVNEVAAQAPPEQPAAAPEAAIEPAPAPSAEPSRYVPPYCTCMASATMPAERASRPSTTVASCDHFLDLAELSARCSSLEPGPLRRMIETLDLSRCNWARAMRMGGDRSSTEETCAMAARHMDESLAETCHT